MQDSPENPLIQALFALTEFPTVAHSWLALVRDILAKPEASPQDGEELARIVAQFQADIELAERNSRVVLDHLRAAASITKGPVQ